MELTRGIKSTSSTQWEECHPREDFMGEALVRGEIPLGSCMLLKEKPHPRLRVQEGHPRAYSGGHGGEASCSCHRLGSFGGREHQG